MVTCDLVAVWSSHFSAGGGPSEMFLLRLPGGESIEEGTRPWYNFGNNLGSRGVPSIMSSLSSSSSKMLQMPEVGPHDLEVHLDWWGVCAGRHSTQECIDEKAQGVTVTQMCINCNIKGARACIRIIGKGSCLSVIQHISMKSKNKMQARWYAMPLWSVHDLFMPAEGKGRATRGIAGWTRRISSRKREVTIVTRALNISISLTNSTTWWRPYLLPKSVVEENLIPLNLHIM